MTSAILPALKTVGTAFISINGAQAMKATALHVGGHIIGDLGYNLEKKGTAGLRISTKHHAIAVPSIITLTAGKILRVAGILCKNAVFSLGVGLITSSITANPTNGIIAFAIAMFLSSYTSVILHLIPPDPARFHYIADIFHRGRELIFETCNIAGIVFFGAKFGFAFGGPIGAVAGGAGAFVFNGCLVLTSMLIRASSDTILTSIATGFTQDDE